MYIITVEKTFSGQHQLKFVNGSVEDLHSHDWLVSVAVRAENLDENGLAIDFIVLKKYLDGIIKPMENKKLEDLDAFKNINASAENVAKYIYDQLAKLTDNKCTLLYVEVTEEPGCKAKYIAND